jgi:cytoskeletal protein CcmA (bactofilin family)
MTYDPNAYPTLYPVPKQAPVLDSAAMDTVFMGDEPALDPLEPPTLVAVASVSPPATTEPEIDRAEPPPQARISLGASMPSLSELPVLHGGAEPAQTSGRETSPQRSSLAAGLSFTGQIRLTGSITVAGTVEGPIRAMDPQDNPSHVLIAPTGSVRGDITARNITVMGTTTGLLDAAGGQVSLHDSAVVSGRIRYSTLQVNGADLNAQLERVRPEGNPFAPQG